MKLQKVPVISKTTLKHLNPDPLVRGTDPQIRIRTKMSRIRNTGSFTPAIPQLFDVLAGNVKGGVRLVDEKRDGDFLLLAHRIDGLGLVPYHRIEVSKPTQRNKESFRALHICLFA
jgi:hypothetical protein